MIRYCILDFGFNGKVHGAEGIAFDFSEISELSTCTLCSLRYRIQHRVSSIQQPVTRGQEPETSIEHREHLDFTPCNITLIGESFNIDCSFAYIARAFPIHPQVDNRIGLIDCDYDLLVIIKRLSIRSDMTFQLFRPQLLLNQRCCFSANKF